MSIILKDNPYTHKHSPTLLKFLIFIGFPLRMFGIGLRSFEMEKFLFDRHNFAIL